jgi:hypothetical protein
MSSVSNWIHKRNCLTYIVVVALVINTSLTNNMQSLPQNPSCDIHQMYNCIEVVSMIQAFFHITHQLIVIKQRYGVPRGSPFGCLSIPRPS